MAEGVPTNNQKNGYQKNGFHISCDEVYLVQQIDPKSQGQQFSEFACYLSGREDFKIKL